MAGAAGEDRAREGRPGLRGPGRPALRRRPGGRPFHAGRRAAPTRATRSGTPGGPAGGSRRGSRRSGPTSSGPRRRGDRPAADRRGAARRRRPPPTLSPASSCGRSTAASTWPRSGRQPAVVSGPRAGWLRRAANGSSAIDTDRLAPQIAAPVQQLQTEPRRRLATSPTGPRAPSGCCRRMLGGSGAGPTCSCSRTTRRSAPPAASRGRSRRSPPTGKLTLGRQDDARTIGDFRRPPTPLTAEERAVFGPGLGRFSAGRELHPRLPALRPADRRDVPRDSRPRRRRRRLGRPVALSHLLRGTGPVRDGRPASSPPTTPYSSCSARCTPTIADPVPAERLLQRRRPQRLRRCLVGHRQPAGRPRGGGHLRLGATAAGLVGAPRGAATARPDRPRRRARTSATRRPRRSGST